MLDPKTAVISQLSLHRQVDPLENPRLFARKRHDKQRLERVRCILANRRIAVPLRWIQRLPRQRKTKLGGLAKFGSLFQHRDHVAG